MRIEAIYETTITGRIHINIEPKDFINCQDTEELMNTLYDKLMTYGDSSITSQYVYEKPLDYTEGLDEFIKQWQTLKNNDSTSK